MGLFELIMPTGNVNRHPGRLNTTDARRPEIRTRDIDSPRRNSPITPPPPSVISMLPWRELGNVFVGSKTTG